MQQSFVWEGVLYDTEEHCAVNYHSDEIIVRSEIEGWAGKLPVYTEYFLKLTTNWEVLEIDMRYTLGQEEHHHVYTRNGAIWSDKTGADCADFGEAVFVDISLTPLTNTLPIRSLNFTEGEPQQISVVYFDVLENSVSHKLQRYTKKGGNSWLYENTDDDFSALITTDDDGFVTDYPNIFKMLKTN